MTTESDHKDYSLTQLEEWVGDCMDSGATPHEIYGTIVDTVYKNVSYHKACLKEGQQLYGMLVGNDLLPEDYDHFENPNPRQDNVIKIEEFRNDGSPESMAEFQKFWESSDFELTSDALTSTGYIAPKLDVDITIGKPIPNEELSEKEKEDLSVDNIGC